MPDRDPSVALALPFTLCASQGGPHEDEAFVSGFRDYPMQEDAALAILGERPALQIDDDATERVADWPFAIAGSAWDSLATERAERSNYWSDDGDLVVDRKTLFRQRGWLGASGRYYAKSQPPQRADHEPSYAPVYEQIATWVDGEGWHD